MASPRAPADSSPHVASPCYHPRAPEKTVLYRALARHLETFLVLTEGNDLRSGLPPFVKRELRAFLDCGVLAKGFARVHCFSCKKDSLLAFSCKKRGFCPSCGGRRMADTAARLLDRVFPRAPVRQWVLSLPYPIRFLLAYRPERCREVRNLFLRTVFSWLEIRARQRGIADPRCGAVNFLQRFGGSLNLNPHFHSLLLDGVYARGPDGKPRFHPLPSPSDEEIAGLLRKVRSRILRHLRKRGLLSSENQLAFGDDPDAEPEILEACQAGSIQGKVALGPKRAALLTRLGEGRIRAVFSSDKRGSARAGGFSLHAGRRIAARDRDRLERLCRYAARPPLSHERLAELPDGRICLRLKTPYSDGTTHLLLDPLTLIEKLAALVPPPRANLVTYHGVLAPNARCRKAIVPPSANDPSLRPGGCGFSAGDQGEPPASPPRRNLLWAELLRRVFAIDVLTCPDCGGRRRVLAAVQSPDAIRRILLHLGLPTEPPSICPARSPPSGVNNPLPIEPA